MVEAYDDGTARLIPLTAIPVPEGRALQVWTLPSRERGPVSVGDLDANWQSPCDPRLNAAQAIDLADHLAAALARRCD